MTPREDRHTGIPFELDDPRHVEAVCQSISSDDPYLRQLNESIRLLLSGIQAIPTLPWANLEANDLSARICFARALRQIRAASMLLMFGYYSEIGLVLRGAFESAGLGRMLAKEPEMAERWLKKGQWFPETDVRSWLRSGGAKDDTLKDYTEGYKRLSALAHPTALSCLGLLDPEPARPSLRLRSDFDEPSFRYWVREITATAVFSSFALRNAAVNEVVLNPVWRKDLYELAEEVYQTTLPHLHRDWEEERRRHEEYRERILPVAEIDQRLDASPHSWRNIRKDFEP